MVQCRGSGETGGEPETETGSAWKRLGELHLYLSRRRVSQSAGNLKDYDEGGERETGKVQGLLDCLLQGVHKSWVFWAVLEFLYLDILIF